MSDSNIYEIEWRELLLKRLKTVRAVLKRDAAVEEKRRAEAKEITAGYPTYEDAHEAYGWGCITEKQLDAIKAIFDNQENLSRAALRRINDILGTLQGEIKTLRGNDHQEDIIQRHAEKMKMEV